MTATPILCGFSVILVIVGLIDPGMVVRDNAATITMPLTITKFIEDEQGDDIVDFGDRDPADPAEEPEVLEGTFELTLVAKLTTGVFFYKEETCLKRQILDDQGQVVGDGNDIFKSLEFIGEENGGIFDPEKQLGEVCFEKELNPLNCRDLGDQLLIGQDRAQGRGLQGAARVNFAPKDFVLQAPVFSALLRPTNRPNNCDQERVRRCSTQQGFGVMGIIVILLGLAVVMLWKDSGNAIEHSSRIFFVASFSLLVVWSLNAVELTVEEKADEFCGRIFPTDLAEAAFTAGLGAQFERMRDTGNPLAALRDTTDAFPGSRFVADQSRALLEANADVVKKFINGTAVTDAAGDDVLVAAQVVLDEAGVTVAVEDTTEGAGAMVSMLVASIMMAVSCCLMGYASCQVREMTGGKYVSPIMAGAGMTSNPSYQR